MVSMNFNPCCLSFSQTVVQVEDMRTASGAHAVSEKPCIAEAVFIGLSENITAGCRMRVCAEVERDRAQLLDGVGLCEAEGIVSGIDEGNVERIVMRRRIGGRMRPADFRPAYVEQRSVVWRYFTQSAST